MGRILRPAGGFAGALTAAFALACGTAADAHPHVWATVVTEVLYDGDHRVSGLRHHWTFDEYYSAFAVQGLDANGDGTYDKTELEPLAQENVNSLKEYDYFTFVTVDDREAALLEPRDYALDYQNGQLTLHFTLPLETAVDGRLGVVSFAVYDPSYYVAFDYAKAGPVRLADGAPKACGARFAAERGDAQGNADVKALGEAFFDTLGANADFGVQFAQTVRIDCRDDGGG